MPVSIQVNSGNRETDVDKVLKGVSIARDLFGLANDANTLFKRDKKDEVSPLTLHDKGLIATPVPVSDLKPTGGEEGEANIRSGLAAGPIAPPEAGPALSGPPKIDSLINGPRKPGFVGVVPVKYPDGTVKESIVTDPKAERDALESDLKRQALQLEIAQKEKNGGESIGERTLRLRDEQLDKRNENSVHKTVIERLKTDKDLAQRLTQYKNLDNALSIITQAKTITPQQVHEFQQAIRGNLGIKGGSGVGERESTYIDSLGLRAAAFKQFLSGEPAQLAKDSHLMDHLKDLAKVEQGNIQQQKDQRINALTAGYEHIYGDGITKGSRADLRKSLDNAIKAVGAQFVSNIPSQVESATHDQRAVEWAKANPSDPRSAKILKLNGL